MKQWKMMIQESFRLFFNKFIRSHILILIIIFALSFFSLLFSLISPLLIKSDPQTEIDGNEEYQKNLKEILVSLASLSDSQRVLNYFSFKFFEKGL